MLIKKAQSKGTTRNYNSHWNQWSEFCNHFRIEPHTNINETSFLWYAAHRFKNTTNKKNTISTQITGVISLENSSRINNHLDRKDFATLRKVIKGIGTFPDRQSEETMPIRDYEVVLMMPKYQTKTFSYYANLWKSMICFAKGFALRCSEYAEEYTYPTQSTLYWKQLEFHCYKDNNSKQYYLQFSLTYSKTNKTWVTEILTKKCTCDTKYWKICPVHVMAQFKVYCQKLFSDTKDNIVFKHNNGQPVLCTEFRKEFNDALRYIDITPSYPAFRANSLRHGEITDEIARGVDLKTIQQFCRHVPGSKSTHIYTHLTAKEQADIMHSKHKNQL